MRIKKLFRWVEPKVGAVCFPQLKNSEQYDLVNFYDSLYTRYQTLVGGGHWFEQDQSFMRIGFGYPTATELEKGLENLVTCLWRIERQFNSPKIPVALQMNCV